MKILLADPVANWQKGTTFWAGETPWSPLPIEVARPASRVYVIKKSGCKPVFLERRESSKLFGTTK